MTQIILNIENQAIVPHLKKILSSIEGVTIAKTKRKRTEIDEAYQDIKEGRVHKASSVDELFKDVLGK